jgi:hypothetical protein
LRLKLLLKGLNRYKLQSIEQVQVKLTQTGGRATGYGLDDPGSKVRFPAGTGNFSLHHRVQTGSGPNQPPIQWVPGDLSLAVKWPVHESDNLPPSTAEVKNTWSYTTTSHYVFMSWCSAQGQIYRTLGGYIIRSEIHNLTSYILNKEEFQQLGKIFYCTYLKRRYR